MFIPFEVFMVSCYQAVLVIHSRGPQNESTVGHDLSYSTRSS